MELVIGVIIIGLCALLSYEKYEHKRTIDKLTNALVAKSAKDFKELETIDKLKMNLTPPLEKEPDLVPIDELSDEEYDRKILEKK